VRNFAVYLSLILAVAIVPNTIFPQEDSGEVRNLDQAIVLALENNPDIRAAETAWHAAQENITVASAWPEPQLSFTQFVESVETRNGPQNQQIAVNQMIPLWGTTGLKGTIAQRQTAKAKQDYEAAKRKVIAKVKSAWADIYWIDSSIETVLEYQELVGTFQDIAETRYATGKGMQTSVLKAQVERSKLDERLLNLREMRSAFTHNLNALLNRPIDAPMESIDTLAMPEYKLTESQLLDSVATYRQDLQGLREMIEANRAKVSLRQKMNLPSLGVGMNYITIGNTSLPGAPTPGADAFAIMAKIDLPLWFGANKARVQEARLGLSEVQYRYADKRNTAESEVRTIHYRIQQTRKSLALYDSTLIPQAEQTLQSALAGYKTGSVSFLDLLDSERMIVQFRLNHYKEQATYFKRLAELEKAVGTDLNL